MNSVAYTTKDVPFTTEISVTVCCRVPPRIALVLQHNLHKPVYFHTKYINHSISTPTAADNATVSECMSDKASP